MIVVFFGVLSVILIAGIIVETVILGTMLTRNHLLKMKLKTSEETMKKQEKLLEYRKEELVSKIKQLRRMELEMKSRRGGLTETEEEEMIEDEIEKRERIVV